MPKVLTERMTFSGVTVGGTAEAPVVEGVLACGPVSANKRRYLAGAFAGDRIARYNNVPVGTYHTDPKTGRKYLEQIGMTKNARHRADGMPLIDIAVNPEKPGARAFLWDARHQPNACSMSHVAHCETTRGADGWEDVTELVRVESVDIIAAGDAATTTSLVENRNRNMAFTRKQLVAWLARHAESTIPQINKAKWLAEEMGDDGMAMDAPPAEDAAPGDTLTDAFLAAAMDEMKECMANPGDKTKVKSCLGKLKKMLNAHAEIKADDSSEGGEEEDDEEEAVESKRKAADPIGIFSECKKAGYEPTASELKYLCTLTESERAEHIAEAKGKTGAGAGTRPMGASRRPGAGSAGAVKVEQAAATAAARPPLLPKFDEL